MQRDLRGFLKISLLGIVMGGVGTIAAEVLLRLINFTTNLAFYHRISWEAVSPVGNTLGWTIILLPVIGGVIVGIMARYGSKAIRGHGIPEAMEQIWLHRSRISPTVTILKPLSTAVSIGTGGPFGAEGPIIATGSAAGSLLGQLFSMTTNQRKILLACGAAAGMTAIFGTPVASILLAIELLLFEFSLRSLVPVAFATGCAALLRVYLHGLVPLFAVAAITHVSSVSFPLYAVIGALVGVASVFVSRAVYVVEDLFEKLPVHWMWWPAIGGVVVGIAGYFDSRSLGVGYENITGILTGSFSTGAIIALGSWKFISWVTALGSGTSGGTLAPLLTFGGAIGALLGILANHLCPSLDINLTIAAAVGMAAMFAGASRAFLTSVIFLFEITHEPQLLLPCLCGCTLACAVSYLMMRHTIMTEKIARRGIPIPHHYEADIYRHTACSEAMESNVQTVPETLSVSELATRIARWDDPASGLHAFPILDSKGLLAGVISRGDIFRSMADGDSAETVLEAGSTELITVYPDQMLHDAWQKILHHDIGRVPVVSRENPKKLVGMLFRRNFLAMRQRMLHEENTTERGWLSRDPASKPSS
ncbi:MAG: chloride channel protein [Chthoniobacterales bacterium]